ncbi:DUF3108 domain-containing protein [Halomonas denitrificans]|nr:DUF3108 domain-containing protein [Halomonas denitrificans]
MKTISGSALHCCWIAIWMLTAVASTATATEAPPFSEHEASYAVTRNGDALGVLQSSLTRREDGLWHYRVESEATAFLVRVLGLSTTEAAWFAWTDEAVLPLTYHHVAERPGRDRFWQHRYDWTELHTDTTTHNGETRVPLAAGAVDPLTLRLAAAGEIAAGRGGEDLEFLVVERDELETQQYRFLRRESLIVDGRCFDTQVYERFRKEGSSRNYIAWHAPAIGGLPVRIVYVDDGDTIVIELDDWSPATALPEPGACPADANTG